MRSETTTLTSPQDGLPLFVRTWLPDGEAKGAVQLAHGMAEHSGRYERFATAAAVAGFAVVAGGYLLALGVVLLLGRHVGRRGAA